MQIKLDYETPELTEVGTFEAITQTTNTTKTKTDFAFPSGTGIGDFSFT
jgi:hypothetical protein